MILSKSFKSVDTNDFAFFVFVNRFLIIIRHHMHDALAKLIDGENIGLRQAIIIHVYPGITLVESELLLLNINVRLIHYPLSLAAYKADDFIARVLDLFEYMEGFFK